MLFEIGLLATVGLGTWMTLDLLFAEGWRRRSLSIGFLGACGALWAGCELLLQGTDVPNQMAWLRRLEYLGGWGMTLSWLWVSVQAAAPRWYLRSARPLLLAVIPAAGFYSLHFWAPLLIADPYAPKPTHGPVFPYSVAFAWILTSVGMLYFAKAALRLRRAPGRAVAMLVGVLLPLVANVAYVQGLMGTTDPTPALLGFAAIMIRYAVIETGLAHYLPLARSDVIDQLEVGLIVTDSRGRVIDANAASRAMLSANDLDDAYLEPLLEAALDAFGGALEVYRFPLQSRVAQVGTAFLLTDRTDAAVAERRLQLAARLEALGSLTAGIAHEINNPLAFIRSNLGELSKTLEALDTPAVRNSLSMSVRTSLPESQELVDETFEGIDRIALLVARLRGFASDPEADAEVDLLGAVQTAANLAGVGLSEGAIEVVADDSPRVWTNKSAVVQVVVNLLLNAIQATRTEGAGATIEVDVGVLEGEAVVGVADRGPGVGDDEHLFEPFGDAREGDVGLGLSIAYDLARKLGGRIVAHNREGGGARFELRLPANTSAATALAAR